MSHENVPATITASWYSAADVFSALMKMFYYPENNWKVIDAKLMEGKRDGKRNGRFCRVMTHLAGLCVLVLSSVPGVNFTSCFRESCFGILFLRPKRKIMLSVCGKKEKGGEKKSGNAYV